MVTDLKKILEKQVKKITIRTDPTDANNQGLVKINNWAEVYNAIIELYKTFPFLKNDYERIVSHGAQFKIDHNTPTIEKSRFPLFRAEVDALRRKCEGIIEFISYAYGEVDTETATVYLKIPDSINFEELENISKLTDFLIRKNPVLNDCHEAKIIGVEKGSSWLTVLLNNSTEIKVILDILMRFMAIIFIASRAYKNFGKGYLSIQKGKKERIDIEDVISKGKTKSIEISASAIELILEHQKELLREDLQAFVLEQLKKQEVLASSKLDKEEETKFVKCIEKTMELMEKGVEFKPSKQIEADELELLSRAIEYPELDEGEIANKKLLEPEVGTEEETNKI